MKTIQLELPDDLARDVEHARTSGAFPDDAEVIRSALRDFIGNRASQFRNQEPQNIGSAQPDSRTEAYERRAQLIEAAWRKSLTAQSRFAALTLPALVEAMRESSQSAKSSTSLYFAGSDVDHPYFLKSDALGFGIAVLPEDAEKAKLRKRHPHQVEVIFVLDGALRLHIEANSPLLLQKGDHYVVGKNVCHWITPDENEPGVFVFVKTNPAQEPRGVSCDSTALR
jgi:Arc/MetJ-type ribon-helix-helix transcriptional regulator